MKKWKTKDRYLFEQRMKEYSREEVEEFLWKRINLLFTSLILMVVFFAALIIIAFGSTTSAFEYESTLKERSEAIFMLADEICEERFGEESVDIMIGNEMMTVYCESEFFTIKGGGE